MEHLSNFLLNNEFIKIEIKRIEKECFIIITLLNNNKHVLDKNNKAITFRHKWQALEYLKDKYNISKDLISFS